MKNSQHSEAIYVVKKLLHNNPLQKIFKCCFKKGQPAKQEKTHHHIHFACLSLFLEQVLLMLGEKVYILHGSFAYSSSVSIIVKSLYLSTSCESSDIFLESLNCLIINLKDNQSLAPTDRRQSIK